MKKKIQVFMLGISVLFLFQACYKDKGNYDLIDYNEITSISSLSANAVILGENLSIKAIIKWKYPNQDTLNFSYEWKQGDVSVSNERDLDIVPKSSGRFMFRLFITENATGIVSSYSMQVTINSPFKAGWLVLSNKDGASTLNYIRRDSWLNESQVLQNNYTFYPDIYKNKFPDNPLGDNPKKLISEIFTSSTEDQVLLIQGNNNTVFLDGQDFSKSIYLKDEFPGQVFPKGANPVGYSDGGPTNFVLFDNGEVYWKKNVKVRGGIHEEMFMDIPVYFPGGGANISQIIENDVLKSFVYIYDNSNNRFSGFYTTNGSSSYLGGKLNLVNITVPPLGFADLNNLNGYAMLYSSDYANGLYYMNMIMDQSTDDHILQTYKAVKTSTTINVSEHKQEVFAGNSLVSDKSVYYRIRNSSYLFFGEKSKLYFYDVNTKRVKLYHDFGSGTIMKITSDADSGELGVVLDDGSFYVCSLKNEILGKDSPGINGGILYTATGLGEIVDLSWKWGSYSDYSAKRYPK